MLRKAIDQMVPDYDKLRDHIVFFLLLSYSFLLRFPFAFRDYIDRDESTFILVAQNWVDGFLPYTELWDLKPPLTFLYFAAIIFLFGKNLIAIRLAGILTVGLIAFFTYLIAKILAGKKIAFWSSVLTVLLISAFGSLQGVMSEHISMLFFMPAVYLLIRYKNITACLIAGLLMGSAVMTKINLAYPALFIGLYLLYVLIKSKDRSSMFLSIVAYGAGILAIVGLTILPYYLKGISSVWWKAVILAPLEYAANRRGSPVSFIPLLIFLGGLLYYSWRSKIWDLKERSVQILLVAIFGVVVALFRGGLINGHYLIQLHPLLIIPVAAATGRAFSSLRWNYKPIVLLLLILLPIEAYKEYYEVVKHRLERASFQNGEGFYVPYYVKEHQLPTENILFLEYHIGYWLLDKLPPTKAATHPTNLVRDETFQFFNNPRSSSMEEIKYIMEELKPEIVITRERWHVFDKKEEEANEYVRNYLEVHYLLKEQIDQAEIHQRLE